MPPTNSPMENNIPHKKAPILRRLRLKATAKPYSPKTAGTVSNKGVSTAGVANNGPGGNRNGLTTVPNTKPDAMKTKVKIIDFGDSLLMPQTPCPEVHPCCQEDPSPTRSPPMGSADRGSPRVSIDGHG